MEKSMHCVQKGCEINNDAIGNHLANEWKEASFVLFNILFSQSNQVLFFCFLYFLLLF